MSYSFQVVASSKEEAKAKAAEEMDRVVAYQPNHAVDKQAALAAAGAFLDMLADDDSKDIVLSMSGSLGWNSIGSEQPLIAYTSSNLNVGAYFKPRLAAA